MLGNGHIEKRPLLCVCVCVFWVYRYDHTVWVHSQKAKKNIQVATVCLCYRRHTKNRTNFALVKAMEKEERRCGCVFLRDLKLLSSGLVWVLLRIQVRDGLQLSIIHLW